MYSSQSSQSNKDSPGATIRSISRAPRFYIELNTQFRTRAKNDFEKNLYKLINNAVFGKTMENMRNRWCKINNKMGWTVRRGGMIAKSNFHNRSVFAENLIAVEMRKLEVKFDKPIYMDMCTIYRKSACTNFITSTCHRCIATNARSCTPTRTISFII